MGLNKSAWCQACVKSGVVTMVDKYSEKYSDPLPKRYTTNAQLQVKAVHSKQYIH